MNYVLDACAIIAYQRGEPGADKLAVLIEDAENEFAIHMVTLGEIFYITLRDGTEADANQAVENVLLFAHERQLLDQEFMRRVGRCKLTHRLPYVDAFVLATAQIEQAPVITTDREHFGAVDRAGADRIVWLR